MGGRGQVVVRSEDQPQPAWHKEVCCKCSGQQCALSRPWRLARVGQRVGGRNPPVGPAVSSRRVQQARQGVHAGMRHASGLECMQAGTG